MEHIAVWLKCNENHQTGHDAPCKLIIVLTCDNVTDIKIRFLINLLKTLLRRGYLEVQFDQRFRHTCEIRLIVGLLNLRA